MADLFVYVDDEPVLCRLFELIVGGAGLTVRSFTDPEQALAFLAGHDVTAVLCDFRMPQMSGLEFLARLEQLVPFLLITGDYSFHEEIAQNPRVTEVIAKPFKYEVLIEKLRALSESHPG